MTWSSNYLLQQKAESVFTESIHGFSLFRNGCTQQSRTPVSLRRKRVRSAKSPLPAGKGDVALRTRGLWCSYLAWRYELEGARDEYSWMVWPLGRSPRRSWPHFPCKPRQCLYTFVQYLHVWIGSLLLEWTAKIRAWRDLVHPKFVGRTPFHLITTDYLPPLYFANLPIAQPTWMECECDARGCTRHCGCAGVTAATA